MFQVEAFDQFGTPLATLPGEVTPSVNYTDADVAGLDEAFATLSRLDPLDQTWKVAMGVFIDPVTNWVWVSTFDTGIFVVHVP
jgi:hypothetical protein